RVEVAQIVNSERPGDAGLSTGDGGGEPVCRAHLIDKHGEVLSEKIRSALREEKFDGAEIAHLLFFLRIRPIPYAVAIAEAPAWRGGIDAGLVARHGECPGSFAVVGELETV